ncbi:MAG: hypothetical protein K8U57_35285 [Planctomycetes bacterium]|nr:hypothetical protein [Planctomycetota bacterium]
MIHCHRLQHCFVCNFPETLEPGVLYVSMEFGTASHCCCCGCGEEVVTPFSPTGWKMTYDGETVSVWPSVGSWTLPCRSHYVIDRGRVLEAEVWNSSQIAARQQDRITVASSDIRATVLPQPTSIPAVRDEKVLGWWGRLRRWLLTPWR